MAHHIPPPNLTVCVYRTTCVNICVHMQAQPHLHGFRV